MRSRYDEDERTIVVTNDRGTTRFCELDPGEALKLADSLYDDLERHMDRETPE